MRHLTLYLFLATFGICCTSYVHAQSTTPAATRTATAATEQPLPTVDEYIKNTSATDIIIGTRADARAGTARRTPIDGSVLNGKASDLPQPAYPSAAKAARVSGVVAIMVVVGKKGGIVAAQSAAGHPLLRAASLRAARAARFEPTLRNGEPVEVFGFLNYHFALR